MWHLQTHFHSFSKEAVPEVSSQSHGNFLRGVQLIRLLSESYPYTPPPNNMTSGYEIKPPDKVVSYDNTSSKEGADTTTTELPQKHHEIMKEVVHFPPNVTEALRPSNRSVIDGKIDVDDRINAAGIATLQGG